MELTPIRTRPIKCFSLLDSVARYMSAWTAGRTAGQRAAAMAVEDKRVANCTRITEDAVQDVAEIMSLSVDPTTTWRSILGRLADLCPSKALLCDDHPARINIRATTDAGAVATFTLVIMTATFDQKTRAPIFVLATPHDFRINAQAMQSGAKLEDLETIEQQTVRLAIEVSEKGGQK